MRLLISLLFVAAIALISGCMLSASQLVADDPLTLLEQGRYHEAMRRLPQSMEDWRVREAEAGHSFEGAAGFEYNSVMFTIAEEGDSDWAAILDDPDIPHAYKTTMIFEILETRLGKGAAYMGNSKNIIIPREAPIDLGTQMIKLPEPDN